MDWYLAIVIIAFWCVAVIAIGMISRRHLHTSRNPLDWLPFLILFPFMAVLFLGILMIIPVVALVVLIAAFVVHPFQTETCITPEGIQFYRRIGGGTRLLKWTEVREVKEVETVPFPLVVAILKTGDEIEISSYPELVENILIENGIPFRIERDEQT